MRDERPKRSIETTIDELNVANLDHFLLYLNDHLSDNGHGAAGQFVPLLRGATLPVELADAFRNGLQAPVGTPGWRRGWIARSMQGKIAGHIDLRARREQLTEHRCLLGMGVDRDHRMVGIGSRLLEHAERWARENGLDWIDLDVLSTNIKAMRLYQRAGFTKIGEIPEMFRIEGRYFSYTTMTKRLCPIEPTP